jgi:hypothetical protein
MIVKQRPLKIDRLYEGWHLAKMIPIRFRFSTQLKTIKSGLVTDYVLYTTEGFRTSSKNFSNLEHLIDFIHTNYSVWNNT